MSPGQTTTGALFDKKLLPQPLLLLRRFLRIADVNIATTTVLDQRSMGPDFSRGGAKKKLFSPYDSIKPNTGTTNRFQQPQQRRRVPPPSRFRHGVDRAPDVASDLGVPKPGSLDATDASTGVDMLSPTEGAGQLPESLQWASTSEFPWRERARKGRPTVASYQEENVEDSENYLGVAGYVNGEYLSVDIRERRRAIVRSEARAMKKQTSDRRKHANAAPLIDLVGVTAPLAFIIGFAMVETFL